MTGLNIKGPAYYMYSPDSSRPAEDSLHNVEPGLPTKILLGPLNHQCAMFVKAEDLFIAYCMGKEMNSNLPIKEEENHQSRKRKIKTEGHGSDISETEVTKHSGLERRKINIKAF